MPDNHQRSMFIVTRFYRISLLIFTCISIWTALPVETTAQVIAGKEFVVALPSFWRRADGGDPGSFQITIMCSRRTHVNIRWSGPNGGLIDDAIVNGGDRLTVQPPRVPVVNLMQEYEDRKPFEVNQRSFYITADQPVTVQVFYDHYFENRESRTEQYTIPPISAYDTSFVNLTYSGRGGKNTGFLLIASEDNTKVDFSPTVLWNVPGEFPGPPVSVTLNKHQVYQVISNMKGADTASDLSGTPIKSDKPIGVISFSLQTSTHLLEPIKLSPTRDSIPIQNYSFRRSPVAEFLPPESKGGILYYTAPFLGQDTSQVRVIALQDTTAIVINGIQKATLNRGKFYEFDVGTATKITTSKPTIAMQFARSGNDPIRDTLITNRASGKPDTTIVPIFGNPFMAWLPPVSEYKPTLQWTNARPDNRRVGSDSMVIYPWYHYALVTAPVAATKSVLIDGQPIKFQFTHIDGQFASAVVPLLAKQHLLTADAPVSCIAYGFGWDDAYGSVSGEALRSIGVLSTDSISITTCDSILDLNFDLSNIGNNNFRIDSIKADGVEIKNVFRPSGFPTEMPPGRELNVQLTLRLQQRRTYTGVIRVYTDANNQNVLTVPFRIVRDSARISIPSLVDFGAVSPAATSFDTLITIKNEGENPVTINTLSFDDPQFVVTQPSLPVTLPPGGSRTIKVTFTPRPGVVEAGTLRILGEPCFTPVDVNFSGFQGAGAILGIIRQIVFPTFLCDAPPFVDTFLVVKSTGDEPVDITGNSIGGDNPTLFSLKNSLAGKTILPGTEDTLFIRYTPTGFGVHQASVILTTSAKNIPSPVTIALNGRRDTATALPSTRSINFGQRLSCDDPIELHFSLTNGGTVDAEITEIQGLDGLPYTVEPALPLSIPPVGTQREITVRFAPTVDGDFNGTMHIIGGPCGIDEVIQVSGSRVTPSLSAKESSIDLGTLFLCEGKATGTLTLKNDGPVADTITRMSPSGSGLFALENPNFPIILTPGEERLLDFSFSPDAAGTFSGTFEFSWGPCNGSTSVEINALVVDPIVTFSATDIDFAQVDITGPAQRKAITITNSSTVDRTISAVTINGTLITRTKPTSLPITLAPGQSIELELEYDPSEPNTLATTAEITIDGPCPQSQTISITGQAIGQDIIDARLTLEVPETLQGEVNRTVAIPILIHNALNLDAAAPTGIEVTLSYRYSMLLPLQLSSPIAGMNAQIIDNQIIGDRRVVRLAFTGGTFPAEGTLGELQAKILLGDQTTTEITIDSVAIASPPNRIFTITTDHGKFTVTGICPIDGDRLIHFGSALKMSAPRPNPIRGGADMEIGVDESGDVELALYDMMGIQRLVVYRGELLQGNYSLHIDADGLAPGMYVCQLRRGDHNLHQTIIVAQ